MAEDERLTAPEVARRLGIKVDTWWAYVTREMAPPPDDREELSDKPWWRWSTILAWDEGRRPTVPRESRPVA